MDGRLDCEVRMADHYRKITDVNAEGWKQPTPPQYRIAVAKALLALATRIAPTVIQPSNGTLALAQ